MRHDHPTVYSTESGRMCPKCGKAVANCICKKQVRIQGNGVVRRAQVRVQRESKGRKGKTVTLVSGVAQGEEALRELLSCLKRLCGSGGTVKEGLIEIQGDHRDVVLDELKKRGFNVKISGG